MGKGLLAKDYREAIRSAKGNVTEAAEALSVSRQAVYDAVARYKTVKDELHKWRETAVTEAEGRLFDAMRRDEEWAIKMVLRTQRPEHWERTQKREVTQEGEQKVVVEYVEK